MQKDKAKFELASDHSFTVEDALQEPGLSKRQLMKNYSALEPKPQVKQINDSLVHATPPMIPLLKLYNSNSWKEDTGIVIPKHSPQINRLSALSRASTDSKNRSRLMNAGSQLLRQSGSSNIIDRLKENEIQLRYY